MNQALFDAIANIDSAYIEEAAALSPAPKRRPSRKVIAAGIAAAVLAVAILPTALFFANDRKFSSAPPGADTPPADQNPPITDPGESDPSAGGSEPGGETPPPPGEKDPPAVGAPMSLGETRTLSSGTTVTYVANTKSSITIFLDKADSAVLTFRLSGSNGSEMYYASSDPSFSDMGTRIDAFTFTVNGKKGALPTAPGQYTIVIDFAPLRDVCRSLGELYSSLGAFFLA